MVYLLHLLYRSIGCRIKVSVNLSTFCKITQIIQAILNLCNVITLEAQFRSIMRCIVRHKGIPGAYPRNTVHSHSTLSLKILYRLRGGISIIGGRLIILHIAKLHKSLLQILYNGIDYTYRKIHRCKLLRLPVNSHAFDRGKNICIDSQSGNCQGFLSTVLRG